MDTSNAVERVVWSNSLEFLMICIANSISLHNLWRFPFVAYENGGGAFFIPYIILLITIGKPMYHMEMIIGQFTSRSVINIYEMSPIFRGVGVGQIIGVICMTTYSCTEIATILFYLVMSFSADLPWSRCQESWGADCVDSMPNGNASVIISPNWTGKAQSSSELYYLNVVLHEIEEVSDGLGVPNWQLVLCLFASWAVVFSVISVGITSSGKSSYFLVLFPYVAMIALLVRALTLEGSVDGILILLTPQWGQLLKPKVWKEAMMQLFFSLGLGQGSIIMYASYTRFSHNINRDALIVTTLDTFTNVLASIAIFGLLGNLARKLNIDNFDEVVKSGTGLAFISYPDAVAKFDWAPQFFAVLFFFMLFVLGIGTSFSLASVVVFVICEHFVSLRFWVVALVTSVIGFGIGLMYVTPGGQWILNLVDHFGGTLLIFSFAMFEMAAVFWAYGIENFCWDLEYMTGRKTTIYWRVCWAFISPVFLILIFFYSMVMLEPLQYSGWDYPAFLISIGWALLGFGWIMVPALAAFALYKRRDASIWATIQAAFAPTAHWGPVEEKNYNAWKQFKVDALQRRQAQASQGNHSWLRQKFFIFIGKYR